MKLDQEGRMTLKVLVQKGHKRRRIARMLGIDESTVRYHVERIAKGASDGRALQQPLAAACAEAITHYLESLREGPVNLADLHEWLVSEHDYAGSLRSVERYFAKRYPRPKQRARRRIETPPGAQAQADWAEWPRLKIGGRLVYAYEFHLRLSHSRFGARVWSPRKDQLAWHAVHNGAFRRLEGITATVRVDNERTAVSRGAGAWGELNPSYRRYARAVRFHIDVCSPRHPQAKGKVERGIRSGRARREIASRDWTSWDELQAWTDAQQIAEAHQRICPATGTTIFEAWQAEKPHLSAVPLLPEPFDVALTRTVARDCTVGFEGRRYSVPFEQLGRRVEVRGGACRVQICAAGQVIAEHRRHGRERLVIDPRHYEGPASETVLPPLPLGRMGRRLQTIAEMAPEQRPLDLYAALAGVAR